MYTYSDYAMKMRMWVPTASLPSVRHLSKKELFAALGADGASWITLPCGATGILQSVQRESGDGYSFNVVLLVCGQMKTFYVKTI